MKFRPTEFLNTPYRVSCYIRLYRKLFSCMRPGDTLTWPLLRGNYLSSSESIGEPHPSFYVGTRTSIMCKTFTRGHQCLGGGKRGGLVPSRLARFIRTEQEPPF